MSMTCMRHDVHVHDVHVHVHDVHVRDGIQAIVDLRVKYRVGRACGSLTWRMMTCVRVRVTDSGNC